MMAVHAAWALMKSFLLKRRGRPNQQGLLKEDASRYLKEGPCHRVLVHFAEVRTWVPLAMGDQRNQVAAWGVSGELAVDEAAGVKSCPSAGP